MSRRKRLPSDECPDCGGRRWGSLGVKGNREYLRCLRCGFDRTRVKKSGGSNKKLFDELYERIYRADRELATDFHNRFIRGTPALELIYEMTEWLATRHTVTEWEEAEIPEDYCDEVVDEAKRDGENTGYKSGYGDGWNDREDGKDYDPDAGMPYPWRRSTAGKVARRSRKARR